MQFKDFLPYLAPLIVVLVIGLRFFRAQKPRRSSRGGCGSGRSTSSSAWRRCSRTRCSRAPFANPYAIPLFAAAALVGCGAGYLRALHQEFSIDPETGDVMSKASPVALMVFVAIFLGALRHETPGWAGAPMRLWANFQAPACCSTPMRCCFSPSEWSAHRRGKLWRRTRAPGAGAPRLPGRRPRPRFEKPLFCQGVLYSVRGLHVPEVRNWPVCAV